MSIPMCSYCGAACTAEAADKSALGCAVIEAARKALAECRAPIHQIVSSEWDEGFRSGVGTVERLLAKPIEALDEVER
jgi:hypothetical protein